MTTSNELYAAQPLVSVVITNYNHGRFIATAIESVLSQTYKNYETIVIDDGSTDDSRLVVELYQSVKYIYQENEGLSAARNKGIEAAAGEYILFLDADDWLYNEALSINVNHLAGDSTAAFVSGAHQKINVTDGTSVTVSFNLVEEPYQQLLQGNYIGMHATVMYRKWVLQEFNFDTSLRGCEDYDIYLRVTKKYPVIHHQLVIASYMHHGGNMSFNHSFMLKNALQVLHRYENHADDGRSTKDFVAKGTDWWNLTTLTEAASVLEKLPFKKIRQQNEPLQMLFKHNTPLFFALIVKKGWQALKTKVKSTVGKVIIVVLFHQSIMLIWVV